MLRHILILSAFLASAVMFAQTSNNNGIVIEKNAKQANPTLIFEGSASDAALNNKILSDFTLCGWFTVVKSGTPDFRAKASGSASDLTITLANSAGAPIVSRKITGAASVEEAAHNAVDAVLSNLFNIAGICRSKLAFSVAVSSRNKDIYMCDFDGSNITRMTEDGTLCLEPQWSPDAKTIIYSYIGPSYTLLKQRRLGDGSASSNTRIISRYSGINAGGALSPDGKTLALILTQNNQVDLFVRPLEGGELKRLTNNKSVESSPCWSPDGSKICFVSDASGRPLLYLIDPVKGGDPVMISGLTGSERVAPDWSSDGRIAYCAKVGSQYQLAVAKITGNAGTMEKIGLPGKDVFPGENPSWAPDNRHIIMADSKGICIIDTRLGTKRVPFTSKSQVVQPSWSPIVK